MNQRLAQLKIAVVDDDPVVCMLVGVILAQVLPKVEVLIFENGQVFCDYLKEEVPKWSKASTTSKLLVLLDLNMPYKNGHEVLQYIEEHGYDTFLQVSILSSSIDETDREKSMPYSFVHDFIEKPLRKDRLIEFLTALGYY